MIYNELIQRKKAADLHPLLVELPGIEPVSGCWSLSRTGTELRNDMNCDSPELTSVDPECAQSVPTQSHNDRASRGL